MVGGLTLFLLGCMVAACAQMALRALRSVERRDEQLSSLTVLSRGLSESDQLVAVEGSVAVAARHPLTDEPVAYHRTTIEEEYRHKVRGKPATLLFEAVAGDPLTLQVADDRVLIDIGSAAVRFEHTLRTAHEHWGDAEVAFAEQAGLQPHDIDSDKEWLLSSSWIPAPGTLTAIGVLHAVADGFHMSSNDDWQLTVGADSTALLRERGSSAGALKIVSALLVIVAVAHFVGAVYMALRP